MAMVAIMVVTMMGLMLLFSDQSGVGDDRDFEDRYGCPPNNEHDVDDNGNINHGDDCDAGNYHSQDEDANGHGGLDDGIDGVNDGGNGSEDNNN